ncbi:sodium/potassium-transporting ATPase subunit alpha [Acrasis kona]|uniref:Sodium/potassium-transporting ATPase subunit alpha n=1 Tax=Acrasis kona TaxID=1008807 RepID=A0AAW2ZPU1_9EUKA
MSRRSAERLSAQGPRTDTLAVNRTSLEIPVHFTAMKHKNEQIISKHKQKAMKGKKKLDVEQMKKGLETVEHLWTLQELAHNLPETHINDTNPARSTGLDQEIYTKRLEVNGPNILTPVKTTPILVRFFRNFLTFFAILLEVSSLLCFLAFFIQLGLFYTPHPYPSGLVYDNLYLGIVLAAVVIITGLFTFFTEEMSNSNLDFGSQLATTCLVVRDGGKELSIDPKELVCGDLVKIKAGEKIPADLRVIDFNELFVDNSSLTGEVEPQQRSTNKTHDNPLETKNLVFNGTLVTKGTGLCVVVATGDRTAIGQIAGLVSNTKVVETPLRREINLLVKSVSVIAFVEGIIFLILGFVRTPTLWIDNIILAVATMVANVPEALLPTVSVGLALTAKRMQSKHVRVKKLESIETLGSSSTICSDKTGTLTQNRMTVSHIWYNDKMFQCATSASDTRADFNTSDPTFEKLKRVAGLGSVANFEDTPENMEKPILRRKANGDASEQAIIKFVEPLSTVKAYRASNPLLFDIPFNSTNKWYLSIRQVGTDTFVFMKGAPERITAFCSHIIPEADAEPVELTQEWKDKINGAIKRMSSFGERVLGFAELKLQDKDPILNRIASVSDISKETPETLQIPRRTMHFVGLMSLIDPPKEGVPEAVSLCITAGIRVVMVTGDHPDTAKAIAKQVNIIKGDTVEDIAEREGIPVEQVSPNRADAVVVAGDTIPGLTLKDWNRILSKREIVFARTSPQQKLIIVEHFQNRGEIVAVTGDGVNDSPALKKADIGIAMNISGSEVSKEAAAMILLDDNFASIIAAVEEGRLVFDNLKKSVAYLLSHAYPELTPYFCYFFVGLPLPLSLLLTVSIDLGLDMLPAIAFAYERPESDIMLRPPRKPTEHMVSDRLFLYSWFQIGFIISLGGLFGYFCVMASYGFTPASLVNSGFTYFVANAPDITNAYGQVYDSHQQEDILNKAHAGYFLAVMFGQWANILVCRCRKLSVFQFGFENTAMLLSMLWMVCFAIAVVYIPGLNGAFGASGLFGRDGLIWLCGLPFFAFILVHQEIVKLCWRASTPRSWVEKHLIW